MKRNGLLLFLLMLSVFLFCEVSFAESHRMVPPERAAPMQGRPVKDSRTTREDNTEARPGRLAEPAVRTVSAGNGPGGASQEYADGFESDEMQTGIPDPLEKLNRAFFQFNDRLYFWFLKPVASGYGAVVPRDIRRGVKNLFTNLTFPVRFVNCLLQGKVENAGDELARFVVNSTIGVAGLVDAAKVFNINAHEEDLGQSLATYGVGPGFFINWPVLGPSSVRGTIGLAGDGFLDPLNYMIDQTKYILAVSAYEKINSTSLVLGEYEDLKEAALDPYIAMRDAYYQYRMNKIKE